jgi:hypothetical protein
MQLWRLIHGLAFDSRAPAADTFVAFLGESRAFVL